MLNELYPVAARILHPLAAMAIYWNCNYCIDFLDEMMTYCGRDDNILANNLGLCLIQKR
jgi:hypothetical protein